MEIGEISLLSIVTAVAPMALFVLLALFAPLVYRRIAGKLIEKFRPHQPQWLSIILDSYLSPTTILLRAVFIYAALWVLPLELNTLTYRGVLARIMQERNMTKTPLGTLTIASAANDDVTAQKTSWILLPTAQWGAFLKIFSELL